MPYEYAPFGEAWVRRADASEEWVEVDVADVPEEVIKQQADLALRHALVARGIHPDPAAAPFAVVRRVSEGEEPFTT